MTSLSLLLLYPAGWICAIARLFATFCDRKTKTISYLDRFLLWIIYLVPIGKLVYFNIPNLMGFKFSFLIWSTSCILSFGSWFCFRSFNLHRFFLFSIFLFFPILSLILHGNFGDLIYYTADEQSDSLGARLASLIFLMMFSTSIFDLCHRHGYGVIVRAFIDGVITAAVIGCIIFILVYVGAIGVPELAPISADSHVVDIIYRFNPGGNVNEFGLISIYALLMTRMAYPNLSGVYKFAIFGLLLFALFFSLTRAAWLAYAGALISMAFVSGRGRKILILAISSFALFAFIVYQLNDDFANIVISRFAFEGGASGEERLDKLDAAFFGNNVPIWRLIFGYGWATNLYLHSVPLQLIYEIGILGYLLISSVMAWTIIKLITRVRREVPGSLSLLGCMIAFCIDSTLHHTLYHMQTWLIFGITAYVTFSPVIKVRIEN